MENNEVMTAEELAEYLKLNYYTVVKYAKLGKLPAFKIGKDWKFYKKSIDEFFIQRSNENLRNDTETKE